MIIRLLVAVLLICLTAPNLHIHKVKGSEARFARADGSFVPFLSPWSSPWVDWKHYHNYEEIAATLVYLNETYPGIVDVFSIGRSWRNKDIYCVKLTDEADTRSKPKALFVGYHHAREPISAELALYFAVRAATSYGTNATITRMLDNCEVYILVALNVDGFDLVKQNDWQRKNAHPFNEDGDGLLDEDPPDDEDGDGYIEDLFYWDGVQYQFIRWEGIDNDGDGLFNEDWIGGVDLNRNYGYQWNATCDSGSAYPEAEDFRGLAPFSEPETQAMRDLALQNDFKYAISFHSGAQVILYPWGYTHAASTQVSLFREVARNLSLLVGAPYEQSSQMYTTSGVWDDWMYGNRSTYALTCEIYLNNSAWQYEPGPTPNTLWERGVFQFFNPDPGQIERIIQKWLPVFTYTIDRAIGEAFDTAITSVLNMKSGCLPQPTICRKMQCEVYITVENQGDFTETFNVTAYANTTEIGTQTVNLNAKQNTTLTFTWNTSNSNENQKYIINAAATAVKGETDLVDNTLSDEAVTVTHMGDVNGDGEVDVTDVAMVSNAFGSALVSNPLDARYRQYWHPTACPECPHQPNADLTGDRRVDIEDLSRTSANFEWHKPPQLAFFFSTCKT